MHFPVLARILVGVASAVVIACSLGIALMKDALGRLHFPAVVTSVCVGLITAAVWLDDSSWQPRIKMSLIAVILFFMNSILSHATARAIRVLENGQFEPRSDERIMHMTKQNPTGVGD